ncbi:unnamed protein product [Oppiella nova]|uniref:TTI1 N-terminal TPR domain-containing protein n=1 Tax=Oppiella nova TaxID=334625 RepID=A0A7R9LQL7_9ACAR|nr:unnamed protein product [Oppiella nova]CAG2165651.1 unnamed protein product [Oppiella nova]
MSKDKELFEELKQRTVNCVNQPNDESIESLRQFVTKCDKHFINSLYQYSIFPLRLIISNLPKKQNNCVKTIESSVECLSLILQKSQINRFDIFADVLSNLLHLIDDNSYTIDQELPFKASEDLILSVVKCAKTLIQNCDDCILGQVVSPSFSAQFGHSIHILLSTANKQKYSLIKAEAIETIDCLIGKCELSLTQDTLKSCPQDLIAYFLPGISINISQVMSSDDKLNRRVISSSLTLLSNTIVFVLKSISCDADIESKRIDSKQVKDIPEEYERNGFHVIRDKKWLENTCDKLNIVFEKIISSLISHQNSNVRQSLQVFVTHILTNCCPLFMNRCLPSLIRVPLTYLSDDFQEISLQSDAFVSQLSTTYSNNSTDSSKSYLDIIEDQIYSYITRLPRIIRTCSEREKITSIYLLYGYIKCLDTNGINYMLYSPQHKHKLFECFIDICQFDYNGIRLLELVTHADKAIHLSDEQLLQKWIRKDFSYLSDEKSETALSKCCQLIAQRVESQVLVDYLMDVLRQSQMNASVVFVTNQILSTIGANYKDTEEVLDLYLTNITATLADKTVENMNKDILRQCLLIEGLTAFLHLYDSESAHNYLLKCIFPLLESVGASNLCVYQTSHRALTLVSQYFGYNSISKLIVENVDYLHFIDNQSVPLVIKVMLKFSTQDMLYLFADIIDEIIVVIDSYHRSQSLGEYAAVRSLTYVSCLKKALFTNFENQNEDTISDTEEECDDKEDTTENEKKKTICFQWPQVFVAQTEIHGNGTDATKYINLELIGDRKPIGRGLLISACDLKKAKILGITSLRVRTRMKSPQISDITCRQANERFVTITSLSVNLSTRGDHNL